MFAYSVFYFFTKLEITLLRHMSDTCCVRSLYAKRFAELAWFPPSHSSPARAWSSCTRQIPGRDTATSFASAATWLPLVCVLEALPLRRQLGGGGRGTAGGRCGSNINNN